MKTQKIESKKLAVPLESLNLWIRSLRWSQCSQQKMTWRWMSWFPILSSDLALLQVKGIITFIWMKMKDSLTFLTCPFLLSNYVSKWFRYVCPAHLPCLSVLSLLAALIEQVTKLTTDYRHQVTKKNSSVNLIHNYFFRFPFSSHHFFAHSSCYLYVQGKREECTKNDAFCLNWRVLIQPPSIQR